MAAIEAAAIPEDVLMDILSRLPAKSLLRFKSVSKHWYSLIQNPYFISLHHARAQPNDCLLTTEQIFTPAVFSMFLAPNQITSPIQDLDLSFSGLFENDNVKGVFFLGCHNGVMCLANDSTSTIAIINPAKRETRVLPQPLYESKHKSFLGFTFDPKADDYKVIRFCSIIEFKPFEGGLFSEYEVPYTPEVFLNYDNYCDDQQAQIYDLSTDSWRETDAVVPKDFPDANLQPYCCTSLNGVFYWFGRAFGTYVWAICAFRTFEEVFERVPLPDGICFESNTLSKGICIEYGTQLRILHDSLALVLYKFCYGCQIQTRFDLWLMDEYGGWTKRYSIGPLLGLHTVVGFRQNVAFLTIPNREYSQVVSYNLSTHEIKEYNQLCDRQEFWWVTLQIFPYAESLIPVKRKVD